MVVEVSEGAGTRAGRGKGWEGERDLPKGGVQGWEGVAVGGTQPGSGRSCMG